MYNKPFSKVYKFLLDKGMVTLGLYRLTGATDNTYPYVYTNPKGSIVVTQSDRVFVLGTDIPQDMIIDLAKERSDILKKEGQGLAMDAGEGDGMGKTEMMNKKNKNGIDSQSKKVVLPNSKDFYGLKTTVK